jgi:hypothetical protein
MLDSMGSSELTEWMAYERLVGPLGDSYAQEMLASITELLQQLIILTAQAKDENVERVPRPHELWEHAKKQQ